MATRGVGMHLWAGVSDTGMCRPVPPAPGIRNVGVGDTDLRMGLSVSATLT